MSRNGRHWYKVQLHREGKPIAKPLKTAGSKFTTADYSAVVALANTPYQQAIFNSHIAISKVAVSNITALTAAYLAYADQPFVVGFYISLAK